MMDNIVEIPTRLDEVTTCRANTPDDVFICFASFEERCLGVANRFVNYSATQSFILHISDEPSDRREMQMVKLKKKLSDVSETTVIETEHQDPILGMRKLATRLHEAGLNTENAAITLDISTFTKKQLLLVLKMMDQFKLFESLRILYTEPRDYSINLDQPLSFGLRQLAVIPTFAGRFDPQKELVLILFLGYEGDRALALWENIEPHRTIAIIPKPAYHPEWEGKTEEMNAAILVALDNDSIFYADSRNPRSTSNLLNELIKPKIPIQESNWYIAPIGTKLQAVGVYYFMSENPEAASIIYASPLEHNEAYFSDGIGRTWLVPGRGR